MVLNTERQVIFLSQTWTEKPTGPNPVERHSHIPVEFHSRLFQNEQQKTRGFRFKSSRQRQLKGWERGLRVCVCTERWRPDKYYTQEVLYLYKKLHISMKSTTAWTFLFKLFGSKPWAVVVILSDNLDRHQGFRFVNWVRMWEYRVKQLLTC